MAERETYAAFERLGFVGLDAGTQTQTRPAWRCLQSRTRDLPDKELPA